MAKAFENIQLEVRDTIDRLKCVKVVLASSRHGDIRFLCRVIDENKWTQILNQFLRREHSKGWYSFFGKKYFINQGKLSYGWVIVFEADDLGTSALEIRKMFSGINEELFGDPLNDDTPAEEHDEVQLVWGSNYYNEKVTERVSTVK